MNPATKHIRHGVGSVRPYLYGRLDMLELVRRAFGAVELERLEAGKGFHVEAKIGDSIIVMEVADPPHPTGKPASIYVYVEDVDAAYSTRPNRRRNLRRRPRRQALPGTRRRH